MKFSIRDILWVMLVVGLGATWWIDRQSLKAESRKWESEYETMRFENFKMALRIIGVESFPQGAERIKAILDAAKQLPPPPEAAAEILHYVRDDSDFRIRVRAMAVLPYLEQREESISVLLGALRDRDKKRSAEGCVPCYAANYLAKMKAMNTKPDIRAWLAFLKKESPYDAEATSVLIEGAERDLARLEDAGSAP